jgi:hypothetical protein
MRRSTIMPTVLTVLVIAGAARAEQRGTVLRLDGDDVYVDVGIDDGVGPSSELVIYHVVVAKHPVTKKEIRDTFPIGTLEVVNAGRRISVATAAPHVRKRVVLGDEVELEGEPRSFADPWEEQTRPRGSKRARAAALAMRRDRALVEHERSLARARRHVAGEEAARAVWSQTLGQAPQRRIELWKAYLAENATSPYADEVRAEVASLREQMEAERARELGVGETEHKREILAQMLGADGWKLPPSELLLVPPSRIYEGVALDLAFHALGLEIERGWAYYRTAGDETYQRAPLRKDADGYLRLRIPGENVAPPTLEYFVEVLPVGATRPATVLGWAEQPETVTVDASVEDPEPDIDNRSQLHMFVDVVDFDSSSEFDQYISSEIDFMYRFRRPFYSLRIGFGIYGGTGGPKDIIDEFEQTCTDNDGVYHCRKVNFHYSFLELEHRFNDVVAVMLRPMAGSAWRDPRQTEGVEREHFDALGLRTRLRLGRETGTNLVLGVQLLEQLGTAFEGAFTWDVIPRFPIVLSALVTDQPVPDDYGVRLIADVGWRGIDWMYPSLRLSYQARDLDHAGLGGGLALNFDW